MSGRTGGGGVGVVIVIMSGAEAEAEVEVEAEPLCPDWSDDERMAYLFSAFKRNREVNSTDWDTKLAFWAALIVQEAARRGRLSFKPWELRSWFRRKGAVPLGLDTVLQDMARRGLIQKESSFAASVDAGWLAWSVGLFLIKPLKWTLTSLLGNNTVSPDEAYVIVECVKEKAVELLQLSQNHLESSHPVVAFARLQEVCQSVCNDEKTFCLCLLQLQREKRVMVAEIDGDKIVKFSHSPTNKVSAVSEIDVGVYQLVKCEKMLTQKVETLSQEAERYKEDARSHLRAGKKHLALKSLRMKKRTDKRLDSIEAKLNTIQTILDRIYSSQTDKTVVEAYQAGLGALRESMKDVSVEKVDKLMDQIEQFCETQDDINQTLAGENLNAAGGVDTDELEAELNALLENTTEETLLLPDVPTRPLPGSPSLKLPVAEVMDGELEVSKPALVQP
ncbi:charged multivesicular body protein 7 isoform X2 [Carcharodon carcharias]|uniref:charged multivesicular body protein 7 isoform X2 n=1 Tax=Carcharodon carcharias TaxID=13397 RepID=UPI001B7F1B2D|nr:charged multivesicular body protein 7 isoform X2 [Carcharodon carcharias]